MNKYVKLVDEKLEELKSSIATVKTAENVAKSTRNTQLYKLGRERRVLCLIKSLISAGGIEKLEDADRETLVLLTTLASERRVYDAVEVKEGDSILELAAKYDDRRDPIGKIKAACEKAGLKMDYTTGLITKA